MRYGENPENESVENIRIRVEGIKLGFRVAEKISKIVAAEKGSELLISWYDPEKDAHFPNVECCGEDDPSWYVYGRSRGGKLLVDVDGYKFLYI